MYCTVHKKYWVENVNIPVSLLFVSDGSCSDMVEVWYGMVWYGMVGVPVAKVSLYFIVLSPINSTNRLIIAG